MIIPETSALETLVDVDKLDPKLWIDYPEYGFRQYFLWKNPATGASIAVLDFKEGGGVPVAHKHASNQFMYCLKGEYAYTEANLVLKAGSFYTNLKDHPHGPTRALKPSILIEIYDGPHYYEKPVFHSDESINGLLAKDPAGGARG